VSWNTIRRDARHAWLLATLSSWAKQTHYLTILVILIAAKNLCIYQNEKRGLVAAPDFYLLQA
jgi:hypothetical protein